MSALLSSLFAEKFDIDTREPVMVFTLPFIGNLGVSPQSSTFWIQNFLLLSLQCFINILAAIAIYFLILKRQGSLDAYLVGYGLILPLLIYIPFQLVRAWDFHNIALMMCLAGANPAILTFRCLEAMHGTLPLFAQESFSNFILYYASVLQFNFDPKTQKVVFCATLSRDNDSLEPFNTQRLLVFSETNRGGPIGSVLLGKYRQ